MALQLPAERLEALARRQRLGEIVLHRVNLPGHLRGRADTVSVFFVSFGLPGLRRTWRAYVIGDTLVAVQVLFVCRILQALRMEAAGRGCELHV